MGNEQTSGKAGSAAGKTLGSKTATKAAKSAQQSALARKAAGRDQCEGGVSA